MNYSRSFRASHSNASSASRNIGLTPDSRRQTEFFWTPSFAASSSCVSPRRSRMARYCSLVIGSVLNLAFPCDVVADVLRLVDTVNQSHRGPVPVQNEIACHVRFLHEQKSTISRYASQLNNHLNVDRTERTL